MESTAQVLMTMPQSVLSDLDALASERVADIGSRPNRSETVRFLLAEYRKHQKKSRKKSPVPT